MVGLSKDVIGLLLFDDVSVLHAAPGSYQEIMKLDLSPSVPARGETKAEGAHLALYSCVYLPWYLYKISRPRSNFRVGGCFITNDIFI